MPPYMCGQGSGFHPRLLGGRLFAGMTVVEGGTHPHPPYRVRGRLFDRLRAGSALSRQGRGVRAPISIFPPNGGRGDRPCPSAPLDSGFRRNDGPSRGIFHARYSVVLSGGVIRAGTAGVCGVDGSGPGVRLVPVLFEFFPDSTLGDGELRGGGFFVLFLLYALGPQGLSASGGPGGSVPACREGACSGPSCFVPGSFGRLGTSGVGCGVRPPPPLWS